VDLHPCRQHGPLLAAIERLQVAKALAGGDFSRDRHIPFSNG
jgi:hypothetical protein